MAGRWLTYPSQKYDESPAGMIIYSIPNWMDRHKILWFQTTNQIY